MIQVSCTVAHCQLRPCMRVFNRAHLHTSTPDTSCKVEKAHSRAAIVAEADAGETVNGIMRASFTASHQVLLAIEPDRSLGIWLNGCYVTCTAWPQASRMLKQSSKSRLKSSAVSVVGDPCNTWTCPANVLHAATVMQKKFLTSMAKGSLLPEESWQIYANDVVIDN